MNHSCQNGGSCVDGRHNYSCKCPEGYTGNKCETGRHLIKDLSAVIFAPTGFWHRGQNPRRHHGSPRIYIYDIRILEKKSRFAQSGRANSIGRFEECPQVVSVGVINFPVR